jgi:hypothetical protein
VKPGVATSSRTFHLVTLTLVSLAMSVSLHLTYLPWWCGDSITYSAPAHAIYTGNFWTYPIARTLGYPLFLLGCELVAGGDTQRIPTPLAGEVITWIQSGLMIASVALTYLTMGRLRIRPSIAFALALFIALMDGVALTQMMLMTETLSLFFMVLGGYLAAAAIDRFRRGLSPGLISLLSGLAWGGAILVRPNLIFVWSVFVGAIPLLIAWRWLRRQKFESTGAVTKVAGPCLAGGFAFVLACLVINYEKNGVVSLSLVADIAYTCPVYNLFDRVHPEDKILGDIMVRHCQQTNHDGIEQRDYINGALADLRASAGQMPLKHIEGRPQWVDLYLYIGSVSKHLMAEHPREWLGNAMGDLFHTANFDLPQCVPTERTDPVSLTRTPVVISVTSWKIHRLIATLEEWPTLLLYLLTFVSIFVALPKAIAAADLASALPPLIITIFAVGSIVCLLAPCFLAGYFNRYSIPVIPLFAVCAGYVIESFAARGRRA